jgi:integrase
MAQQGSIFESHGSWYVRWWEKARQKDGSFKWEHPSHRLASKRDFPKKSEVKPLVKEFMDRVNRTARSSNAGIAIVDFFENVYIPGITGTLECSTVKGYKDSWRCHIRGRVSGRVRDFRTCDGENLMCAIEAANKTKTDDLAHGTYKHIKVTLSAMFTFAKRKGVYEGVNPMTGVTIPKGKKYGRKRLAYTLEEVGKHLELFSGAAPIVISTDDGPYTPEISQRLIKALIGVAAFAGLREGEIRGQWWEDDDGKVLNIRRSVWRSHLKYETKTHEDEEDPGVVPIIEPLRVVLDAIKPENASGWMFPNTIGGALDLDNLADRVIKPIFKAKGLKWKGWHAYRRGLATNLHELGVPDIVIQAILRHEDIRTTQRSYIKTVPRVVTAAMKRLESQVACTAVVQQTPPSNLVN